MLYSDLVKRHELGHNEDAPNKKAKLSTPRPRIGKACVNCSLSKLRCEGTNPCPRCARKGLLCEYRPSARSEDVFPPQDDHAELSSAELRTLDRESEVTRADHDPTMSRQRRTASLAMIDPQQHFFDTPHQQLHSQYAATSFATQYHLENPFEFNNAASAEDTTSSDAFGDPHGLATFLRDVIDPGLVANGSDFDTNLATSWDVLDFGVDQWQELFQESSYNPPLPALRVEENILADTRSGYATPNGKLGMPQSTEQAWNTSLWRFVPASHDHGGVDQANLVLSINNLVGHTAVSNPLCASITQLTRDRVLGMVLATCQSSMIDQVMSSFPSAEILTNLIHKWLEFHSLQASSWLHIPTFDPREESPEILLNMVAAGASLSHLPQIRKLGLALLEAARQTNANMFEKDNRAIRHLRPLQCQSIQLDAYLWSGERRLMEIAESFSQPLITMLRRGGRFQHSSVATPREDIPDEPQELENKWRQWIEHESFKRVALACLERDVQTSMSLCNPPLISCSELTLLLPLSKDLWCAKTAVEWRQMYHRATGFQAVPSVRQYVEMSSLSLPTQLVDRDYSLLVWLYGLWTLAWSHRQWTTVSRHSRGGPSQGASLVLNSLQQEITKHLEYFQLEILDYGDRGHATTLVYERFLMNMYSSLEDLQLLAGKSGQEEARKAYYLLTEWAQGRDAREAVLHAGQLLRAAKGLPTGMLQHANAVACYHAGLVLWAFSVVSKGTHNRAGATNNHATSQDQDVVLIDGEDVARHQRFVVLGKGTPAMSPYSIDASHYPQPVSVFDTRSAMRVVGHLLRSKNRYREEEAPPLIENLSKLLRGLGRVAQSV